MQSTALRSTETDVTADYLRNLGRAKVMSATEEAQLAHAYRQACLAVWQHAVHRPELVMPLLAQLRHHPPTWAAELSLQISRPKGNPRRVNAGQVLRDADGDQAGYHALVAAARHAVTATRALGDLRRGEPDDGGAAAYWREICRLAGDAELLRNQFVERNLRLVVSVAKRYRNGGMAMIDLISEGNLGLVRAVERFVPERGFRFSTYATWWIRHAIGRAISDRGRSIRIPVHMLEAIHKLTGIERAYLRSFGEQPDVTYLAAQLGMSADRTRELVAWRAEHAVSIDAPASDDGERTIGETLHDADRDAAPQRALETASTLRAVVSAMRTLPPVEAAILRARFGVDDGHEQTLQELGERHNLSRERIRQIQEQSLRKLRKLLDHAA